MFPGGWSFQDSRQSVNEGGKVVSLKQRPPLPSRSRSQVQRAAEIITTMENPMISSGIEPATFLLVAQCLNQLRHRVSQCPNSSPPKPIVSQFNPIHILAISFTNIYFNITPQISCVITDTSQTVLLLLNQQLVARGGHVPSWPHCLPLQQQVGILMTQGIFIQYQNKTIFYFWLKIVPAIGDKLQLAWDEQRMCDETGYYNLNEKSYNRHLAKFLQNVNF